MEIRREFICRVPETLVKDPALLPLAKLLYLVLAAHADGFRSICFRCNAWEKVFPPDLGPPD